MAKRRRQNKKPRARADVRTFEATAQSAELAREACAEGLPAFFIDTIAGAYGLDTARQIARGIQDARERPVTLRANTILSSRDEVAEALDAAKIPHAPVPWYRDAFVIPREHERAVWDLDLIGAGKIYLQSLSSMMPPLVLDPKPAQDILDMCAAPGGKTTQIAALQPAAHVTACEMHVPRAEKLEHNLAKQGAKNVQVMRLDARELDEFFSFDQILLDAPCTGSGTLVAGIERTLRGFTPELLQKCATSQRALLDRALTVLKPGGTLLYSTCSVLPQENEDAVREGLARHKDCHLVTIDGSLVEGSDEDEEIPPVPAALAAAIDAGDLPLLQNELPGTVTVCPARDFEGFYLALIEKCG